MRAGPRAASASASEPQAWAGCGPDVNRPAAALRSADFKRVLASRPQARSEHFVLHHCPSAVELSTAQETVLNQDVDDVRRFGAVIPKRHARRAVTRSLMKRQGRAAWRRHATRLRSGDWVLRLRTPFDPARYPSAASDALRESVRHELDRLFAQVAAAGGA